MTETAKERIYREALEEVSRSLPVNSKLDLVIAEALIKAKYLPITTDKLSVEKLEPIGYYNGAHGFLHDELDKDCYCQGGCSMEAVYTESQVKKLTGENKVEKLQERCDRFEKALTEIIFFSQGCYDSEYFASIAQKALAAIGGDDEL
ncbi:MAG: hypothetical protein ACLSID_08655 [Lactococcus lactis]